jgi:hypothetical protein
VVVVKVSGASRRVYEIRVKEVVLVTFKIKYLIAPAAGTNNVVLEEEVR